MAVGGMENPWWADVLRHGQASRYATFFDIDWNANEARGKLLAPFLGKPYARRCDAGAITLDATSRRRPWCDPLFRSTSIRPVSRIAAVRRSGDGGGQGAAASSAGAPALPARLVAQSPVTRSTGGASSTSTVWWDCASRTKPVFEATHATLLPPVSGGADRRRAGRSCRWPGRSGGLLSPPARALEELAGQRPADAPQGRHGLWSRRSSVRDERLPDDWAVDGTSGYDFMDEVSALLHDGGRGARCARFGQR